VGGAQGVVVGLNESQCFQTATASRAGVMQTARIATSDSIIRSSVIPWVDERKRRTQRSADNGLLVLRSPRALGARSLSSNIHEVVNRLMNRAASKNPNIALVALATDANSGPLRRAQ